MPDVDRTLSLFVGGPHDGEKLSHRPGPAYASDGPAAQVHDERLNVVSDVVRVVTYEHELMHLISGTAIVRVSLMVDTRLTGFERGRAILAALLSGKAGDAAVIAERRDDTPAWRR